MLPQARVITRHAVKGVSLLDGGLLMMRSAVTGDLKFPGGGMRDDESPAQALARELREECGRDLVRVGPELLTTVERRPDASDPTVVFPMLSSYQWCTFSDQVHELHLDAHERDLRLSPVAVDPWAALAENRAAAGVGALPWTRREILVLQRLLGIG